MKKIPTLFMRNPECMSLVLPQINPECEWVFEGEGTAYIKLDGTCCMVDNDGRLYKRRMVKEIYVRPGDFIQADYDPNTGKSFGWVPCKADNPADKYHWEAWPDVDGMPTTRLAEGTYELVGPKVQGGAEKAYRMHTLVPHNSPLLEIDIYLGPQKTAASYTHLKTALRNLPHEGVVWHHPDGRMAKLKRSDFGWERD